MDMCAVEQPECLRTDAAPQSLLQACILDLPDSCTWLLHGGESTEVRDSSGFTPLHLAVAASSWSCVEVLLDHGADIATRARNGSTLLHTLAYKVTDDVTDVGLQYLTLFIQLGADVEAMAAFPLCTEKLITAWELARTLMHERAAFVLRAAIESLKGCVLPDSVIKVQLQTARKATRRIPALTALTRNSIRRSCVPQSKLLTKHQLGLPQPLVDFINLSDLTHLHEQYFAPCIVNR